MDQFGNGKIGTMASNPHSRVNKFAFYDNFAPLRTV
jgi:hypothetical protein